MSGHKIKVSTYTLDKNGKLVPKKPRSVSAQVAIAKSKKQRVVSAAKARAAK